MKKTGSDSVSGSAGRLHGESGVGLTEILVSLVIFSTAMLGIVGTSTRVGITVNSSHGRIGALAVARQHLETVMADDYADVVAGTATQDGVNIAWTVSESAAGKNIVLVYRYALSGGFRQDTLTAGLRRP